MEGRRIFANTMKYVLMATSSNFGNMFSAAGARRFSPSSRCCPRRFCLNNLLYNAGQLAYPPTASTWRLLRDPPPGTCATSVASWPSSARLVQSSTSHLLRHALAASRRPREFRTGCSSSPIATQTLVVYVIRTRRVPFFKSRPSVAMILVPTGAAIVGALLPYTGWPTSSASPCCLRSSSSSCSAWSSCTSHWSNMPAPVLPIPITASRGHHHD